MSGCNCGRLKALPVSSQIYIVSIVSSLYFDFPTLSAAF